MVASSITVTLSIPRWRTFAARVAISAYRLAARLGFYRPSPADTERAADRIAAFLASGLAIRKR